MTGFLARHGMVARCPVLLLCLLLVTGCALPSLEHRAPSAALDQAAAADTPLGRALVPATAAHPGLSGIHALSDPRGAFAVRALLARAAQRTIDAQYYAWQGDTTGTLLLRELHAAAERGVRVRLLLDDNGTSGLDDVLVALDAHPNAEVRLFNPFTVRAPRALNYVIDFPRANRRMHNKSFTVDNQATVVGGRNVGDEYFGATDGALFRDLDVLAVGAVVAEVSRDFDRYWSSRSSYPAGLVLPAIAPSRQREVRDAAERMATSPAAREYVAAIRASTLPARLLAGGLDLEWTRVRMVSDDPAKGLGEAPPQDLLTHGMGALMSEPAREADLVSPYFVPTRHGVDALAALTGRGVRVRVLTNSAAATDVSMVHAGYAQHRRALLSSGVALFELRRLPEDGGAGGGRAGLFGSASASLHAKTFAVDRTRIFIGSFNLDPRSARLNTEMGFVIDSPRLAGALTDAFEAGIPASAYELGLDDRGRIFWIERRDGQEVRHGTEPETSALGRLGTSLLGLLPIDSLL